VWIAFWNRGDLNKARPMTQQAIGEYGDRLNRCLKKSKMSRADRQRMDALNAFWMSEYVIEELGGYKLAFAWRAEESEKHGDFLLAAELRSAAAEYCTLVAVPYHERIVAKSSLHRKAADAWKQRAREHKRLARGDRLLARIKGLQAPASRPDLGQHYFNSYRVFHKRVLSPKGGRWLTGRTPGQVATVLRDKGLKHPNEAARVAVVVVANGRSTTDPTPCWATPSPRRSRGADTSSSRAPAAIASP